jgi:hypothetical protein
MLMSTRENVLYPNPKRVVEFTAFVTCNLPAEVFQQEIMQHYIDNPQRLREILRQLVSAKNNADVVVAYWQDFYRELFGLEADFSGAKMPEVGLGYRIIGVAQGLTLNRAVEVAKSLFPVWTYADDLDTTVLGNDRIPEQGYFIAFRDVVEADEGLKNQSADDLAQAGIPAITLLERLILEIEFFRRTGGHLDVQNTTLCAGSRGTDGGVPCTRWLDGLLQVFWNSSGGRFESLRARSAVLPL